MAPLFSISYRCHPSHWLIFFREVGIPPTRYHLPNFNISVDIICQMTWKWFGICKWLIIIISYYIHWNHWNHTQHELLLRCVKQWFQWGISNLFPQGDPLRMFDEPSITSAKANPRFHFHSTKLRQRAASPSLAGRSRAEKVPLSKKSCLNATSFWDVFFVCCFDKISLVRFERLQMSNAATHSTHSTWHHPQGASDALATRVVQTARPEPRSLLSLRAAAVTYYARLSKRKAPNDAKRMYLYVFRLRCVFIVFLFWCLAVEPFQPFNGYFLLLLSVPGEAVPLGTLLLKPALQEPKEDRMQVRLLISATTYGWSVDHHCGYTIIVI